MSKTAVILAGGKGTRLHPYTIAMPKPLVPVGDKPILEIIIVRLVKCGFDKIIITVNHQADIIMAYFGDGSKWGTKIEYSLEDKPLGTMGPLKLLGKKIPQEFLVTNGDVLSDIDYSLFLENHSKSGKIFTIASHKRTQVSDYGILDIRDDVLNVFKEKPETHFMVSMGIYAVSKEILNFIPANEYFGFDTLMLSLLEKNIEVGIYEHNGYWMDIGRPSDYEQAVSDWEQGILSIR